MAKKVKTSEQSPLSYYWTPPAAATDGGWGEPWACLATTFEFDADFFETELLPRFLGLKFDQTENESSFLVEREQALDLARVAVLVDHSRFDSSQTTLRWDQIPIHIPGGIQHAKITILAWDKLIRVIIGSANVKRIAYRRNREIFAALDFWNSPDSTPLRILRDILDLVTLMLSWSRSSVASVERTQETVEVLRRAIAGWDTAPADFTSRERPRVALAVTHPRATGRRARSTLDEVIGLWGNRRASSIVVVSPFTAREPDPEIGDAVVNKLAEVPMTRECEGWLVGPELPKTPEDQRTRLPFPEVFKESWKELFHGRGGAYVLPLSLCVEGKEDRNRTLHSKSIVLENENDDVAMMMMGSSNFTLRGMGIGFSNFEANLVFEDVSSAKRGGMRLIDRLGLPREWQDGLPVDEVVWLTPEEPPEDEPASRPALPAFFAWATYSQVTGELKLGLDRTDEQPKIWSVRLGGTGADAPTLFTSHSEHAVPSSKILIHVLSEAMHAVNIVALVVQWEDRDGESQQAKLGVSVEGEKHLLPPEQFLKLDPDAIIECLISGKTPSQWFDQKKGAITSAERTDTAIEMDTSSFLLYRVRRFGRALTGMSQRIMDTIPRPDAIRYRLLRDPFGPISLAQSISRLSEDEPGGWCAQFEGEHRVFLLTEILLTTVYLRSRIASKVKGKERESIEGVFGVTIQQLREFAESVITEVPLPKNLRDYLTRVQSLADPAGGDVTEALNVD